MVRWTPASIPAAAEALGEAGFSPRLATLLARRGVSDRTEAEAFLKPDLDQLHDPRLLAGIEEAVARLLRARDAGERVALVGDYDVDGVSGTALLTAVLRVCGIDVQPILPHRMRDGYGFQPVHVERARELGCSLVVTVDCGTSSIAAAKAARQADLDVVVTDHHLPGDSLPKDVVLINPRQEGCDYPFVELSGAGLALKLALALADACGRTMNPRQLLRIACLGTIADMVPLRGENRIIAAVGLAELSRTRSPGLQALLRTAGLRPPLTAEDVGFRIGPRLNAPGRLDSADKALALLLSRDQREAGRLALELDRANQERQAWERQVVEEARAMFLDRPQLPGILVAWSPRWHRGVVGIAAGRFSKELGRPTILLAIEGNSAVGSGRSIPDIHLYRFLTLWSGRLSRFGGHAQAVGMTIEGEDLEAADGPLEQLRGEWEEAAAAWNLERAVRQMEYELDLTAGEVDESFLRMLERLGPYGQGNPQPLLRIGGLHLAGVPRLFGRGHLAAEARDRDGGRIRLLGWGWAQRRDVLDRPFEVLGHLERDRYRGGPVLRLVDCRPAESAPTEQPVLRSTAAIEP